MTYDTSMQHRLRSEDFLHAIRRETKHTDVEYQILITRSTSLYKLYIVQIITTEPQETVHKLFKIFSLDEISFSSSWVSLSKCNEVLYIAILTSIIILRFKATHEDKPKHD